LGVIHGSHLARFTTVPGTKYLATLMAPLFNKSVTPGWDISMFAKNTEKKRQISSIILPSKTEKEI
jgi:hypothetical protein